MLAEEPNNLHKESQRRHPEPRVCGVIQHSPNGEAVNVPGGAGVQVLARGLDRFQHNLVTHLDLATNQGIQKGGNDCRAKWMCRIHIQGTVVCVYMLPVGCEKNNTTDEQL